MLGSLLGIFKWSLSYPTQLHHDSTKTLTRRNVKNWVDYSFSLLGQEVHEAQLRSLSTISFLRAGKHLLLHGCEKAQNPFATRPYAGFVTLPYVS